MGYRGPAPVAEDLVPRALKRVAAAEFMDRLPAFDDQWAARVKAEAARGRVLRYVVTATPRTVSAKLAAVATSSPVGRAPGHAQPGRIHDPALSHEPLVISGPGAGAEVTAAGILNDIYSLSAR